MILESKKRDAHLASCWVTGISIVILGVGLYGATCPLQSPRVMNVVIDTGDTVAMEEFNAPPPAPADPQEQPQEEQEVEEVEIPPLPELQAPLTPPEMTEITPLEEIQKPPPAPKPPEPKRDKPKPVVKRFAPPTGQKDGTGTGNRNGSAPTLFTGGGGGRFPHPSYPSAARSAKQQGTVRVLVTVEASGLPTSVSVSSSSGSSILDESACSQISRKWRWPSGDVRRFIVPVHFVLH